MDNFLVAFKDQFRSWLVDDTFPFPPEGVVPVTFESMRAFIRLVALGNVELLRAGVRPIVKFPPVQDLDMAFGQFLELKIQREGREPEPLFDEVRHNFCVAALPLLFHHVTRKLSPQELTALYAQHGVSDYNALADYVMHQALHANWPDMLMRVVVETLAERPLRSFFIRTAPLGQFPYWGQDPVLYPGRKLAPFTIDLDSHHINVAMLRCAEVDGANVTCYQWFATLCPAGSDDGHARARGVLYAFDREDGRLLGSAQELFDVASALSQNEIMLAESFARQHGDYAQLIEEDDLCFVSMWDRQVGTVAGLGAQCLQGALGEIRRRFGRLNTVVIDTRPTQFRDWPVDPDPPVIAIEKQLAIERIVAYVQRLELPQWTVRHIFNAQPSPADDYLALMLDEMLEKFGGRLSQSVVTVQPELDLDGQRSDLADFFADAGMDWLSERINAGECASAEVEAVLKYYFLDQRMLYLRKPWTGDEDPEEFETVTPARFMHDVDTAHLLMHFLEDLPEGVRLGAVVDQVDENGVSYPLCVVVCDTVFGPLVDYYLPVPKPRPLNVARFLGG